MQARYPDRSGYTESHGVPTYWEQYGDGDRTVLFMPPWQITHSRIFKQQYAYFARYFRVLTYDPPGNGRSGRPATGYDLDRCAADALAVLVVERHRHRAGIAHRALAEHMVRDDPGRRASRAGRPPRLDRQRSEGRLARA